MSSCARKTRFLKNNLFLLYYFLFSVLSPIFYHTLYEKMDLSKVGIVSHPKLEAGPVQKVIDLLSDLDLVLDPATKEKVNGGHEEKEINQMRVDVVIALGGDGTVLWTIKQLPENVKVLPINAGRIGYMAEYSLQEVRQAIERLLARDFHIEERRKLEIEDIGCFLNELILYPTRPAKLLEFNVWVSEERIMHLRCDGILVSTPTGSTAYSFSMGNPIIHPSLSAYLLAPIWPLVRDEPTILVPDELEAKIEVLDPSHDVNVILDGQVEETLKPGSKVKVKRCEDLVKFVRFDPNHSLHYLNIRERK